MREAGGGADEGAGIHRGRRHRVRRIPRTGCHDPRRPPGAPMSINRSTLMAAAIIAASLPRGPTAASLVSPRSPEPPQPKPQDPEFVAEAIAKAKAKRERRALKLKP